MFLQTCEDGLGLVGGDGEADSLEAAAARGNGGVDADDFAVNIHKRSAAVAGVDGSIDLNKVFVPLAALDDSDVGAVQGGDDSVGHGADVSEGGSEGHHPIAFF